MSIPADPAAAPAADPAGGLSKVAEVTTLFWVIKVLSTGLGETAADWLMAHTGPRRAAALGGAALLGSLVLQVLRDRYVPWVYWLAIVMVGIFGTIFADLLHFRLDVPLIVSTGGFSVALAVVFWLWHRSEGTLSFTSIRSRRREIFYWLAVLITFALGTAAGDLTAHPLGLGYLGSGFFFTALIAIPAVAWRKFGLREVAAFWAAYIITRPLGASFADWMALRPQGGALGWGTGPVSVALALVIVACVGWLTVRDRTAAVAA